MLLPLAASLLYYVWLAGTTVATVVYTLTKLLTATWPIVFAIRFERRTPRRIATDWRRHLRALPLGVLTGVIMGGGIIALYVWTPVGEYGRQHLDTIRSKLDQTGIGTPARYLAFTAFLTCLHSMIEEMFWRYYVFGQLRRVVPLRLAYLLASLAFAAHHFVVCACYFPPLGTIILGLMIALGGGVWCWSYRRQGTLAGNWLSHAIVDACIFGLGYVVLFT